MVYFIQNDKGNIKIGYTEDIEKRKSNLEVGNDHNLTLIATIPNVPQHFETHLHGICEKYHIKGEWYTKEGYLHLLSIEPISTLIHKKKRIIVE